MKQIEQKEVANNKSVQTVIETSLEQIKALAEANTIVGSPILTPSGITIIPVSKVSVGFVVGGGEYGDMKSRSIPFPMAASTGGGVALNPIGFLIDEIGVGVRFVPADTITGFDSIVSATSAIVATLMKRTKEQ